MQRKPGLTKALFDLRFSQPELHRRRLVRRFASLPHRLQRGRGHFRGEVGSSVGGGGGEATVKQTHTLRSADPAQNLVKWWIVRFIWRAERLLSWSGLQAERTYFAAVKLVYTIGYSASLVLLALAVLILLLFR